MRPDDISIYNLNGNKMALCGFHRKIRIVITDPENRTNNVHPTSGQII
jgi:hypothetical protein